MSNDLGKDEADTVIEMFNSITIQTLIDNPPEIFYDVSDCFHGIKTFNGAVFVYIDGHEIIFGNRDYYFKTLTHDTYGNDYVYGNVSLDVFKEYMRLVEL